MIISIPFGKQMVANLLDMSPAYFGMAMATGIVSLAARRLGMPGIAMTLFLLNIVIYGVLWVLTVLRLMHYPRHFFADMIDHLRGPGFFTMVAASAILGNEFVVLTANYRVGVALWGVAIVLWIGLTYTIFTAFTVKQKKPTLDKGISGGWLLAVVATQSIGTQRPARCAYQPALQTGAELFCPLDVAVGRHAVHLDDVAHFLPLYLFPVFPERSFTPLLDQHGGHGDFHPGRFPVDHQRPRRAIPAVLAAVSQGLHGFLLGYRNLVDSNAGDSCHVASSL